MHVGISRILENIQNSYKKNYNYFLTQTWVFRIWVKASDCSFQKVAVYQGHFQLKCFYGGSAIFLNHTLNILFLKCWTTYNYEQLIKMLIGSNQTESTGLSWIIKIARPIFTIHISVCKKFYLNIDFWEIIPKTSSN